MTVPKPTLPAYSPGHTTGFAVAATDYDNDVLQQGARTQSIIEPVTAFPPSPALNDWCVRSDLNALYLCTNATGPVWNQMSIGAFATTARPAAPPTNYRYYDLTDGAIYRYNGSSYDGAWVAPTLLNSWVNSGGGNMTAGYSKDAMGTVHIRGICNGVTVATTLFALPAGYQPSAVMGYGSEANGAFSYFFISGGNLTGGGGSVTNFNINVPHFDTR